MILITTYKSDKLINRVTISGHSGYKTSGSDIVCSAVSTAALISFNLIGKVCPNYKFNSDDTTPFMDLSIIETNDITNIIIDNLLEVLKDIESQYPKYVKIKNE